MGGVSAPFGWKMLAFAFQQPFQLGLAIDLSPKGDSRLEKSVTLPFDAPRRIFGHSKSQITVQPIVTTASIPVK